MSDISTSDLATIFGARAATPAEAAQATRDAEAFDRDVALESHGHSVSPSAGQFWSGRRDENRNDAYAKSLARQPPR